MEWFRLSSVTMLCILVLTLYSLPAAMIHAQETQSQGRQPLPATPTVTVEDGLETVAFDTLNGVVEVSLPDDASASDTISGTVLAEPKGETKEEIARNEDELSGYVVEIAKTEEVKEPPELVNADVIEPEKSSAVVGDDKSCCVKPPHVVKTPPVVPIGHQKDHDFTCVIPPSAGDFTVILKEKSGRELCRNMVRCRPAPPPLPPIGIANPPLCKIPAEGTCGKPIVIPGRCDGRSSTSRVKVNGKRCRVLAESPRRQIVKTPVDCPPGECVLETSECGFLRRGSMRLLPAPPISTRRLISPSPSVSSPPPTKKCFYRTGPFLLKKEIAVPGVGSPSCEIGETKIVWTDPKLYPGKWWALTFTPPPETLSPGDVFPLTMTASGSNVVSPQSTWFPDPFWMRGDLGGTEGGRGGSRFVHTCTLSSGYGIPAVTMNVTFSDYDKQIEDWKKANPSFVMPAGPQWDYSVPKVKLHSSASTNVELEWRYVREPPPELRKKLAVLQTPAPLPPPSPPDRPSVPDVVHKDQQAILVIRNSQLDQLRALRQCDYDQIVEMMAQNSAAQANAHGDKMKSKAQALAAQFKKLNANLEGLLLSKGCSIGHVDYMRLISLWSQGKVLAAVPVEIKSQLDRETQQKFAELTRLERKDPKAAMAQALEWRNGLCGRMRNQLDILQKRWSLADKTIQNACAKVASRHNVDFITMLDGGPNQGADMTDEVLQYLSGEAQE